jgi:hypothetical protein
MNGLVNIYLRGEEIIVAPCAGGGGVSYEIEPVLRVPPKPDEVGNAIVASLAVSAREMGKPLPNLRDYRSPVLTGLGLRSLRQFYINIAFCVAYRDLETVLIQPYRPAKDGRGFELGDEALVVEDQSQLGDVALQVLRGSTRLNPSE